MERTILHVDINNCYASIECLHNPKLAGKPVAVGGDVQARRGIILAKNYKAKDYGVQVGQALWEARQKCPELVIVPPNYALYLKYARYIRDIFASYTDMVEPFGMDEAWLDVSGSLSLFGKGEKIAEDIRRRVKSELGVTVSIGVSFNKIFAKLGSDIKKPDAVTVLDKQHYQKLIYPLPVENLLYVGKATQRKLYDRGVRTIGELIDIGPEILGQWLGKWGYILYSFAHGDDLSPVAGAADTSVVKSIGNSVTAPRDLECAEDVKTVFFNLSERVAARLRDHGLKGTVIQIMLRNSELFSLERQMKLSRPTNISGEICSAAMRLLINNYSWDKPLRSVGIRAAELVCEKAPEQITMPEDEPGRDKTEKLERCIDGIRARFGHSAIIRGTVLKDKSLSGINSQEEHIIHPAGYFGRTR